MSDNIKLVIEIPKDIYARCKEYKLWSYDAETLEGAVATSKPLSENKGEWIKIYPEYEEWNTYECSHCGEEFGLIEGTPYDNGYYFCPNCGADMRGGQR